jgi:hypothetical protein
MRSLDESIHSFIVRVWLEPREIEGAKPKWRGSIEHVNSGEQRYLKSLEEVTDFIASYLEKTL